MTLFIGIGIGLTAGVLLGFWKPELYGKFKTYVLTKLKLSK